MFWTNHVFGLVPNGDANKIWARFCLNHSLGSTNFDFSWRPSYLLRDPGRTIRSCATHSSAGWLPSWKVID